MELSRPRRGGRRVLIGAMGVVAVVVVLLGVGGSLGWINLSPGGAEGGPAARCAAASPAATPTGEQPESSPRAIATGLCVPWGLAFLPDGTALVTERDTTRILSLRPDGRVSQVQSLPEARQQGNSEAGLLGIAVSPTYDTDRWVYAYYTTEVDNRIGRFRLGQTPQPVLTGLPFNEIHNGGRIAFGPDGMLYASTGDAGQPDRAQDPAYLGGKILRLTPDGRPAPGNPFPSSPVWSLGHRNVQGLAWDGDGRLFASEFGQDRVDELNRIEPGRNYGWPAVEGVGNDPRFVDPIATWAPAEASPSGIAIAGDHVYLACLRGQRLYRVGLDGRGAEPLLVGAYGRLRHAVPAPDGSLWLLTSNRDVRGEPTTADDRIIRFVP